MNNAIIEFLKARHATRSISPEPLDDDTLDGLIEALRLTPSCFNNQPWRFQFLLSDKARSKGAEALADGNRPWASRAPLLVIGYTRKEDDCVLPDGRAYHQFDLGMAVMNLVLAATEQGLVARPMAGFDPGKAREFFGLKLDQEPLVMLAIGKPALDEDHLPDHVKGLAKKPRERKPASEIVARL
ncbi:MAG TPA: nitroreductase family protein [Myxococcota bacterium]|nr:nitroreductase family protein [Myxococcota bacterium]